MIYKTSFSSGKIHNLQKKKKHMPLQKLIYSHKKLSKKHFSLGIYNSTLKPKILTKTVVNLIL